MLPSTGDHKYDLQIRHYDGYIDFRPQLEMEEETKSRQTFGSYSTYQPYREVPLG